MTTATAPVRADARSRGSTAAVPTRVVQHPERSELSPDHQPVDLESLSANWQRALDAAGSALRAAGDSLPAWELRDRRAALARETETTVAALRELGRGGRQPAPWLSPVPVTNAMLGLPATVGACLFDVEGVLTDSSRLHAWAWGEVFDDFLSRLSGTTNWHLIPFDRVADYRAYVEGRPRLDGVHTFLRSRGIQVPEGRPDDPSNADTAHGLARRKGRFLERRLQEEGVTALRGARRYLEAARRAGLERAVVYESSSTLPMLEQAGLAALARRADRCSSDKRRRTALAPRSGSTARGLPSPRRADGTHGHLHEQPCGRRRRPSSGHVDRRSRRRSSVRVARGVRRRPRHSLAERASRPAADSGARRQAVVPGT